jgi:hypothetical protein
MKRLAQKTKPAEAGSVGCDVLRRHCGAKIADWVLEARAGVEPTYSDLQSGA